MKMLRPGITIKQDAVALKQNTSSEFSTLLISFDTNTGNSLDYYDDFEQTRLNESIQNDMLLQAAVKSYFEVGGIELYLLNYAQIENFDLNAFEDFVHSYCDNLQDLEVIFMPTLLETSSLRQEVLMKIMNVVNDYAYKSDRISICDVNENILSSELDNLNETVIYYPGFINKDEKKVPASVVASALMSKLAHEEKFFHSIANKEIVNLSKQDKTLTKSGIHDLEIDGINPIIYQRTLGHRIWGIKVFNSHFNSVNELRSMKYIKRQLKALSREFLFEPNSVSLHDRLFFKINFFLHSLWQLGALSGATQDEAYVLNAQFNENDNSENTLVFSLSVALAKPLEFITIKLHRLEHDGTGSIISMEN